MRTTVKHRAAGLAVVAAVVIMAGSPASAHVHEVHDHAIAHGQHHPVFVRIPGTTQGISCDSWAGPGGAPVGPAWYGLEVAHHGPDLGTPGQGDGCYQTFVSQGPGPVIPIDTNPAID